MRGRVLTTVGLLMLVPFATATPYWVAWEGDDLPENQGWNHVSYGPAPIRYLDNGELVIDSRASILTSDYVEQFRLGAFDPAPGEYFGAEWRVWAVETVGLGGYDLSVAFTSDQGWNVGFRINGTTIKRYDDQEWIRAKYGGQSGEYRVP